MNLKILYMRNLYNIDEYLNDNYNYYIIIPDKWNDFLYQTSFEVKIIKNNLICEAGIKILFRGQIKQQPSYEIINSLTDNSSTIEIRDVSKKFDFISMGNHYEDLKDLFNYEEIHYLLNELNDINYIKEYNKKKELVSITKEEGFELSLLREQYAKRIFQGINTLLQAKTISSDKYHFNFQFELEGREYNYSFNFHDDDDLPSRINVIIGKNGVGKSKTLETLVNYLLNPKKSKATSSPHPNFLSNLCVFSYNPYDDFYIHKNKDNISIKYKYFGFNRNKILTDGFSIFDSDYNKINIDVLKVINDKYRNFLNLITPSNKKNIIEDLSKVLKSEINVNEDIIIDNINISYKFFGEKISDFKNFDLVSFNSFIELCKEDNHKLKYIVDYKPLSNEFLNMISKYINKIKFIGLKKINGKIVYFEDINFKDINFENIKESEYIHEIFYYDSDKKQLFLSSGQKMYSNLLLNLYSMITENSLIIIDEPENTLHPNFEIGFIKILNNILEKYNSFAIIATHSSIIAREIPSKFINIIILNEIKNLVEIQKPCIKSFGASITEITNYIFDDVFYENKLYSEWLENKVNEYKRKSKNFKQFQEDYKDILSYELLLEANDIFEK